MNNEDGTSFIPRDLPITSTQILCPILCLICLLILVQRIKHRSRWPALSRRQMDSQKSLPERFGAGGNKEKTAGTAAVGQQQQPMSNSPPKDLSCDVRAPLPSACDILQPLSRCTPLPSSGQLAAKLSQERQAGNRPSLTMKPETPTSPESSTHAAPAGSVHASGSHQGFSEFADQEVNRSPRPGSGSSEPVKNPQSAFLPPSTGISNDRRSHVPRAESNVVYTAQKRSETVQHLQDTDENGVRKWKRRVVEYS
ncbi:uncharacterized protein ACHE_30424S [Aspergillus chevalieri]|uniref:Uncharacterized protein n=1 Tax=Aspergillus chevalieri TaxID=182096 RepID=A0A7R7VL39_ASPCH|nr:uncharacterized protein ACHE_30424S [Aspergillus chevalieri]BCR86437.1 hypothetical protein ACHE_30424S [Aspergillus chevalieri]